MPSGAALGVVIADTAIDELAARAESERWPGARVVTDPNTREACGERVLAALRGAGIGCEEHVFPQRSGLLAGLDEVSALRRRPLGDRRLVAVGSGVITDIVRFAAHSEDRDFISVPTAASMDGYASSVAAMQLDGVKVTFPARAPAAIFADPRVVAAAPAELTRAGIGDLLAKATARIDWLASHLLYGEPFDDDVAERVLEPLSFAASSASRVLAGDPSAVRSLLVGLVQSGVAMAMLGNSRPASGCEHHASHFWDLLAAHGRRQHASHGLQVGYATRFAMRMQRFAFGGGVERVRLPAQPRDPLGPAAREWLGEPTAELVAAVEEKRRFTAAVGDAWPVEQSGWIAIRSALEDELELFAAVSDALDVAAIPAVPGYLEVDERTLRATFRYASRLRARYTVIDFLEGQGRLDEAIEAMLASRP